MKQMRQPRGPRGFPWLVAAVVLALLALPLPLHACLEADAGGCSCCCSHEDVVMSCCDGESAPSTEPSCCFTIDTAPGLTPSQHRDATPTLHLLAASGDVAPFVIRSHAPSVAVPAVRHVGSTARRLSVLCSFLN